jgi:hypothetical protein
LCRCKSMMSVAKRGLGVVDFPDFGCLICNMKIGTANGRTTAADLWLGSRNLEAFVYIVLQSNSYYSRSGFNSP